MFKKITKLISIAILFFVIVLPVSASPSNLWEYYNEKGENLPSVSERAVIYEVINQLEHYSGTVRQNAFLLDFLLSVDDANSYMDQSEDFGEFFGGAGGSAELPQSIADFESSLVSRIEKTDTSMSLVDSADGDGNTLSGWYGFTIDINLSKKEYVIANCTGASCVSMLRGVSYVDGVSTSSDRAFTHGRGADVSITNHPNLIIITNILNGIDGVPDKLYYDSGVVIGAGDDNQTVPTKKYIDDSMASGVSIMTETVFGGAKVATRAQMSSGYNDINDPRVLTTKNATSTGGFATTSVVITEESGTIDNDFLKNSITSYLMPVGSIISYGGSSAPSGWLACNGQAVSTSTYSDLYAVLGSTYGATSTTFNLPDLRGRNIVGYGTSTPSMDEMGETGGATSTTLTIDQIPAHAHTINTYVIGGGGGNNTANSNGATNLQTPSTSSQGGGEAHSNMDPFIVLQYIIKY